MQVRFSYLLGGLVFSSLHLASAVSFSGDFTASKICPLYVSKNQQTNPGNIVTQFNQVYKIKEANATPASWYRVVANAQGELRWVEASCGSVSGGSGTTDPIEPGQQCVQSAGKADGYVFAVSMQAAFCETGGYAKGKPECTNLTAGSPYTSQFSLHGLWPNQNSCGTNYGFCDNIAKKNTHCEYTPIALNSSNETNLKKYMASYQYGSCLERHEWYKHGSCQLRSQDDYYALAVNLTEQMNNSPIGTFIKNSTGQTVTVANFKQLFEQSFGAGSSKKIKLICKNALLTDVYIELPNLDGRDETKLTELLPLAKDNTSGSCGTQFKLSSFSVN